MKKIRYFGIAGCTSLEHLTLPESITQIEKAGLARNLKLKSVNIPKSLTTVPEYCLMGCSELEELYVPDNIETINDKAFSLSGISKIRLPEGVKISETILDGCKELKTIVVGNRTVIDLDEIGEKLTFEGFRKSIDEENGHESWEIAYSDDEGNIHTREFYGIKSIQEKEFLGKQEKTSITPKNFGVTLTKIGKAFSKVVEKNPKEAICTIEEFENVVEAKEKANVIEQNQGEIK